MYIKTSVNLLDPQHISNPVKIAVALLVGVLSLLAMCFLAPASPGTNFSYFEGLSLSWTYISKQELSRSHHNDSHYYCYT